MKPFNTRMKRPEEKIQDAIRDKLHLLGWFTIKLHGNQFQSGMPDLYATHSRYGCRLIEVKNPTGYHFTAAQLEVFPKLVAHGSPVWVLISDQDDEIKKLFGPANWHLYLYAGRV